jgi:hypothetical protein
VIAIIAATVSATVWDLPRPAAPQPGFAFYINVFAGN